MTGGLISFAIECYERLTGGKVQARIYARILIGCLSLSLFLAWREEYMDKLKLSHDQAKTTGTLEARNSEVAQLKSTQKELEEQIDFLQGKIEGMEKNQGKPVIRQVGGIVQRRGDYGYLFFYYKNYGSSLADSVDAKLSLIFRIMSSHLC